MTDDEYYPENTPPHSVTFLEQSDYKVAYTGTEMVYQEYDAEEQRMAGREKLVFSRDFSYKDLLIVNYIPFNLSSLLEKRHPIRRRIRRILSSLRGLGFPHRGGVRLSLLSHPENNDDVPAVEPGHADQSGR
ncbi:MAG: hypothetical protein MZW92_30950 [Comamonadaceae bacterium]|nr:hypothetical protein [Comamonadaceae bacterium]